MLQKRNAPTSKLIKVNQVRPLNRRLPTAGGWLYLGVVLDMFSRCVVGWAMDERITQELTLSALRMAIATRRPTPGLLHDSDRGSQYSAHAYRHLLARHGMRCFHEPQGQLLGQRTYGELLRQHEGRTW